MRAVPLIKNLSCVILGILDNMRQFQDRHSFELKVILLVP